MQYWLMKTEPNTYSIDDLKHDKRTEWDGVRNYQARNFMCDDMKVGDKVLFYHSNAKPSGIAGIAKVCSKAYPDPTQFDPKSDYYDPKATQEKPRWFLVDVCFVRKFEEIIPLQTIKEDRRFAHMPLVQKGQRLSVQPVPAKDFHTIEKMAK